MSLNLRLSVGSVHKAFQEELRVGLSAWGLSETTAVSWCTVLMSPTRPACGPVHSPIPSHGALRRTSKVKFKFPDSDGVRVGPGRTSLGSGSQGPGRSACGRSLGGGLAPGCQHASEGRGPGVPVRRLRVPQGAGRRRPANRTVRRSESSHGGSARAPGSFRLLNDNLGSYFVAAGGYSQRTEICDVDSESAPGLNARRPHGDWPH